MRINGVLHEFSHDPGRASRTSADIILNLKEVRLRLHADGPKTLRIHKTGAGVAHRRRPRLPTTQTVEILNPEHKIATLSPEADVEIEVTVDIGKGYVLAEKNKTEEMPIGTIPIDSIFSPVRRSTTR